MRLKTWAVQGQFDELRIVEAATAATACRRYEKAMRKWWRPVVIKEVQLVADAPVIRK